MKNIIYSSYPPPQINSSSFNDFMNYSPSSIPNNFNYFQGMLPYFNYHFIENYQEQFPFFDQKNSETNLNQTESPIKSTTNDESKDREKDRDNDSLKEKENYINLLINTVNNLFSKGKITQEYLNSETLPKFDPNKFTLTLNNYSHNFSNNLFSKKCDNKICAYLADNSHKLFLAKFFLSNSYKPKNLWLCEKCYKAYSLENYCYYCHVIYREYEHGTQYYDKKKCIQCDYCSKWIHMQCEEKKGKYQNIEELSMNNNFKYMCPFCRKEHESIMRQKHRNEKMKRKGDGKCFLNIKRKEKKLPSKDVANILQFNKINKINFKKNKNYFFIILINIYLFLFLKLIK